MCIIAKIVRSRVAVIVGMIDVVGMFLAVVVSCSHDDLVACIQVAMDVNGWPMRRVEEGMQR